MTPPNIHYDHLFYQLCRLFQLPYLPIGKQMVEYLIAPITDENVYDESYYFINEYMYDFEENDVYYRIFPWRPTKLQERTMYRLLFWFDYLEKQDWRCVVSVAVRQGANEAVEPSERRSFWMEILSTFENSSYHQFYLSAMKEPKKYKLDSFVHLEISEEGSEVEELFF